MCGSAGTMSDRTNPITPAGFAALRARYEQLFAVERPAIVEVVSWAAGNGDRSENGDYIYGRQKLRAIDRELGQLSKKMKFAKVIDPANQEDRSRVFFGATVTIADADDINRTITLVGDDETAAGDGRIGWNSPLARALRGSSVGDVKTVTLPGGSKEWEVMAIGYPQSR
jgi:transcription elongation factor GreB